MDDVILKTKTTMATVHANERIRNEFDPDSSTKQWSHHKNRKHSGDPEGSVRSHHDVEGGHRHHRRHHHRRQMDEMSNRRRSKSGNRKTSQNKAARNDDVDEIIDVTHSQQPYSEKLSSFKENKESVSKQKILNGSGRQKRTVISRNTEEATRRTEVDKQRNDTNDMYDYPRTPVMSIISDRKEIANNDIYANIRFANIDHQEIELPDYCDESMTHNTAEACFEINNKFKQQYASFDTTDSNDPLSLYDVPRPVCGLGTDVKKTAVNKVQTTPSNEETVVVQSKDENSTFDLVENRDITPTTTVVAKELGLLMYPQIKFDDFKKCLEKGASKEKCFPKLPHVQINMADNEEEESIYENTKSSSTEPASIMTNSSDDRSTSSGYRSSSSPSTEELYVNKASILAAENLTNSTPRSFIELKDIAIGNSLENERRRKKKISASSRRDRSTKRNYPKQSKEEEEEEMEESVNVEEIKSFKISSPGRKIEKKSYTISFNKPHPQQDRSVDVYNETVRQRVSKTSTRTAIHHKDVFVKSPPNINKSISMANISNLDQKNNFNLQRQNHDEDDDDEDKTMNTPLSKSMNKSVSISDIPAIKPDIKSIKDTFASTVDVSKLRSKFEEKSLNYQIGVNKQNLKGVEGYRYPTAVFSLTRRSATITTNQTKEQRPSKDNGNKVIPRSSWNPTKIINKMYKINMIGDTTVAEIGNMEGYLDHLPIGKKRPTIWSTWQRHFFVAKEGILQNYDNNENSIDRLEIAECGQVELFDSIMLIVKDSWNGQFILLRCKTSEEAQAWYRCLTIQSRPVRSVIQPCTPTIFTNVIVIDLGGASVRAGIVAKQPSLPELFFPSVMAVSRDDEVEKYFGMDAFAPEIRNECYLCHPIATSASSKNNRYSINQIAVQGIFEKIFKELSVDPAEYSIQLSLPRIFSNHIKVSIAGMLFEEFGVRAINMAHQSTFALYAYKAQTGIMVDIGERMDIAPFVDGALVSSGVSRSPYGGLQLRSILKHKLQNQEPHKGSPPDEYLVRHICEKYTYLPKSFEAERERYRHDAESIRRLVEVEKYCSNGGKAKIEIISERFETPEGLFKPELWGIDQAGIHVLIHKAICECNYHDRKEVITNIFLAGGLTLIPGFPARLEAELERLSSGIKHRVHASPYRYHAAYLGACVHAESEEFDQSAIKREEWSEKQVSNRNMWTM